ncbi:Heat shock factor protein 2 [Tupaia chinensis]|uniref:Heat shock factor protein 2 n=1 Tax=Tupaia chinensis TaxID=246437 RepID=L9JC69_TUPCH|nr:Heat shock factor protein 2 [Tupaia chinensis]
MKQSSNVPAFLSKLWTLVEETHTNEFITWSQNGQSFLVLDEQMFAKEILPKYFKHNNVVSFVRQLNMYGFHKVVHTDSGIVKQERDGPVEFQYPYFKQGQDELLENTKRKVSSSKPEENKIHQEDLTKIISSAQKVQIKQKTIESRFSELKNKENIPVIPETNEDVISDPSNCSQYPDVIVEDHNENKYAPVIQSGDQSEPASESLSSGSDGTTSPLLSSAVQLNSSSSLIREDPVIMRDSILNDNMKLGKD